MSNDTEQIKKDKITKLIKGMFKQTENQLEDKINKMFRSGAVDVDSWDEDTNQMILPKAFMVAFLRDEADQYTARGTSFEKQVKKEAKNIGYNL